jgi:(S)-mandelate dehydrogenase
MSIPLNADDWRRLARRRLPRMVFDFLEGGAEGEAGLERNRTAFAQWDFAPRRLADVSRRSLAVRVLGRDHAMPLFIAPTGLNGIYRPGADAMLARAASAAGIPFALSTASNAAIEEIARVAEGVKWFQLYVMHRDIARTLTRRARNAGFDALILTVDVPVNGYRERDLRNGFGMPPRYTPRVLWGGLTHPAWSLDLLRHGFPRLRNFDAIEASDPAVQAALLRREMDASFDWDALAALRDAWPRPLIVKGILREDEVSRCAALGVDAVILSNHGGRQIDGAIAPITALAGMTRKEAPLLMLDSGIRRGADVLKALCLGAGMAGVGRAALYALAAGGEAGVTAWLSSVRDEMDRLLALLGVTSPGELGPELLHRAA